ncbi:CHAD domain-containing protein [Bdellovibrio sp. HCB-162]|uniref:CHAD domain-containing protein n=1 Tax=Bdellovibrio sp. HCB-162 TaxID=3394234 RepID=UPI0039BC92FB
MTESERQLRANIQEFSVLVKKVAKDPKSKDIHELRILSRKFRAALWIVERVSKNAIPKGLKKELRILGKKLGTCRELDVLLKDTKTYNLKDKNSEKSLKKELQDLQKFLDKSFYGKLQKNLEGFLAKIHGISLPKKDLVVQIKKGIRKWPQQMPEGKKDLHEIRIETKKMIYRLEFLGIQAPTLKALQKSLGRTHDLESLKKSVGSHKKLDRDLKALRKKAEPSYKRIIAS